MSRVGDCGLLAQCLDDLAAKHPGTKFVKIISTDCIPKYPDQNLPTVLLYRNTQLKQHLVGLLLYGGRNTTSAGERSKAEMQNPVRQDACKLLPAAYCNVPHSWEAKDSGVEHCCAGDCILEGSHTSLWPKSVFQSFPRAAGVLRAFNAFGDVCGQPVSELKSQQQ